MARKTGLGKGLGAFFGDDVVEQELNSKKESSEKTADKTSVNSTEKVVEASTAKVGEKTSGNKVSKSNGKTNGKTNGKSTAKNTGKSASKPEVKEVIKTVEVVKTVEVEVEKQKFINIAMIEPNESQPRKIFKEDELGELADSIKQYGMISPIVVQENEAAGGLYQIIAGERRYRAAKLAGLTEVPVIVRSFSKQEAMEVALIENVQRQDLNPIEEAKAYQSLVNEFELTQEEVAQKVSKSRAVITNTMRLLKLDDKVQQLVIEGKLSSGHARALVAIEDLEIQQKLAEKIVAEGLSVREVEKLVKALDRKPRKKKEVDTTLDIFYQNLEENLRTIFGTKVNINKRDNNKGKIEIEYYSSEEFERILDLMKTLKVEEEKIS